MAQTIQIGRDGRMALRSKKSGKVFSMWPVDAREALATGGYELPGNAPVTAPVPPPAAENKDDAVMRPVWLNESGKPALIEDEESVTLAQLKKALHEAGEPFRSDANKATLFAQWNEFVTSK